MNESTTTEPAPVTNASDQAPLVQVRNLRMYFPVRSGFFRTITGQVKAVDDVTFSIARGETLGLVGESGCGKTTVGGTILRLYNPTEGEILFEGQDIAEASGMLRTRRRNMQLVFQDPFASLNPRMTVRAIIEEGLVIHGIGDGKSRLEKVRQLLARVGLDESYINRYPHEFSGGQRQRICIARALAMNPKFIVLDEPVSALDVSIQSQIINLLNELKAEFDLTYLFISHDLSVVEYVSDRVAVMYLGEIVEMADAAALYKKPWHPYTDVLFSSTPVEDPRTRRKRIILEGDVPSPMNPPSGCRFHPRCPRRMPECSLASPPPIQQDGRLVCCYAAARDLGIEIATPAG